MWPNMTALYFVFRIVAPKAAERFEGWVEARVAPHLRRLRRWLPF